MNLIKHMKIKRFLTLFILLFILVPASMATIFVYRYTRNTMVNSYAKDYAHSIFNEIQSNIGVVLSEINALSVQLTTDEELQRLALKQDLSYQEYHKELEAVFENYLTEYSVVEFVDYITPQGERHRIGIPDTTFSLNEENLNQLTATRFFLWDRCTKIEKDYFCAVGKKLYYYNKSYAMGSVVFYVNQELFGAVSSNSDVNDSIFFISTNGKIISHPEEEYLSSVLYIPTELFSDQPPVWFSDNGYVSFEEIFQIKSLSNSLKCTALISHHELFRTMNTIFVYMILSFLGVIFIALISSVMISKGLLKQISLLQKSMMNFSENYEHFEPLTPSNEISALEISFNEMAQEIRSLIKSIEEEKEKQRIAELKALQSQIKPHFLYNALGAISWKAKENHQYEIDDMLISLATFYRIGLHKGDDLITISEELQHIESYLEIECKRFPELFDVSYEIDERVLKQKIPKIILQPLVENCISHGFAGMHQQLHTDGPPLQERKGHIHIKFRLDHEVIRFEVADNGYGMQLEDGKLPKSTNPQGGYGLHNVNERLMHFYGAEYSLKIESAPGKGMRVLGSIPYQND